ncbi:MAG: helix-turn-helix domain-containing protein [Gemmatimonadales bacterium]|nr:helix-turn-helix domain-containing protein [Gemmatimonadales bacterium]
MNRREAVLAALQGRSPDDPITLPASWILAAIGGEGSPAEVDMSAPQVAELLGRTTNCVAGWCRLGLFRGAYRLRGREWRIPRAAFDSFQRSGGIAA